MEDCSTGQSAVVWVRKPNFRSFCCGQPFVCQVRLSSGPPEASLWIQPLHIGRLWSSPPRETSAIWALKFSRGARSEAPDVKRLYPQVIQKLVLTFSYCAWLWNRFTITLSLFLCVLVDTFPPYEAVWFHLPGAELSHSPCWPPLSIGWWCPPGFPASLTWLACSADKGFARGKWMSQSRTGNRREEKSKAGRVQRGGLIRSDKSNSPYQNLPS